MWKCQTQDTITHNLDLFHTSHTWWTHGSYPGLPRIRRLLIRLWELLCVAKLRVLRPRCLGTLLRNGCRQVGVHLWIFEDTTWECLPKLGHYFWRIDLWGGSRGRTPWGWVSCRGKVAGGVRCTRLCRTWRSLTRGHAWSEIDVSWNENYSVGTLLSCMWPAFENFSSTLRKILWKVQYWIYPQCPV